MNAKVKERIELIRTIAEKEIPSYLKSNNSIIVEEYRSKRVELNKQLIQVLIGGKFVQSEKTGEWKVKFNESLPTRSELAEVMKIMEDFVKNVEGPVMDAIIAAATADDGMEIPPREEDNFGLPKIEKINTKKVREYILGGAGNDPLYNIMIGVADCMEIAALGEDLRKHQNMNKMLIAGGIVLILTGAAVAMWVSSNNKKDGEVEDGDCDDLLVEVDMDSDEFPVVDIDSATDDCPVVTLD